MLGKKEDGMNERTTVMKEEKREERKTVEKRERN